VDGALPLWLKLAYTLMCVVIFPIWLRAYGPRNFLWFSDIALFTTAAALWLESALLASMMALAVVLPETGWAVSFFGRLFFGLRLSDIADYMFHAEKPLYVRALSLFFHVAMPAVLIWIMYRLGYDTRAFVAQTVLAWIVLPVTYALTTPRENINWVYGPWGGAQTRVPRLLYLAAFMVAVPLAVYLPMHFLFQTVFGRA
jgi:hypothetical protein